MTRIQNVLDLDDGSLKSVLEAVNGSYCTLFVKEGISNPFFAISCICYLFLNNFDWMLDPYFAVRFYELGSDRRFVPSFPTLIFQDWTINCFCVFGFNKISAISIRYLGWANWAQNQSVLDKLKVSKKFAIL